MISINKTDVNNKKTLVNCVKDLYRMGFTSPVSGNHSVRMQNKKWMWITPSGIPRYNLQEEDLVKVHLETGKTLGRLKPSIEWYMHVSIYKKLGKVNAIVHTHSPYTLGIAISVIDKFQHIIEEAKIVVGNPVIIPNKPSGSTELANIVSEAFGQDGEKLRAVIIKNHGVVAVGSNIHQARAVVEALEEWAKILTISKIFGGPKYVLDN
ncbi:MAG: class II aldolase family protein [Candidatus Nitrosopolaris wilkensis]|nr:MAG: class II aldolase family protein [Candidatus Nitrosopolaris wilkensis]